MGFLTKEQINKTNIPNRLKKEILELYPNKFKFDKIKAESYFLYGKPGTGKTIKAIALAFFFLNNRITSYNFVFGNVPEILFELRQVYNKKDLTEESIINKYADPKILILDDFGVEKTSDWTIQSLYLIVNRRYNDNKLTITTSNLNPKEIQKKMDDGRVISRLISDAKIKQCSKQYRI